MHVTGVPCCTAGPRAAGAYVFADPNPFLADLDSQAKARDLFRRGVLTGVAGAGARNGVACLLQQHAAKINVLPLVC